MKDHVKDDGIYLGHILECIERIENYTAGGRKIFSESSLVQDAVLRNLQTLGQSAVKLSAKLKSGHPDIDWRGIIGFRNVLVHDYLGINISRVWEIVEEEIPPLKQKIAVISNAKRS